MNLDVAMNEAIRMKVFDTQDNFWQEDTPFILGKPVATQIQSTFEMCEKVSPFEQVKNKENAAWWFECSMASLKEWWRRYLAHYF